MPAPKDNASSGTVTCPKCKGRKVSAHWMDGFRRSSDGALPHGWGGPAARPLPPIMVCRPGQCPALEHLHRVCDRCGYPWTTPIAGGTLGPIVQATEPARPDASRDPGHPPARPDPPPNRAIREGDSGPRVVVVPEFDRINVGARPWWRFW